MPTEVAQGAFNWEKRKEKKSQVLAHNGLMACCSYEEEKRDLLGSNFPLWCWRMFLCKPVVGVCFLGWDLWLWALGVCVGDWSWWGVDWPVELLLAGGRHCWTCWNLQLWIRPTQRGGWPESGCFFFCRILKAAYVMFSQLWIKSLNRNMPVPTNS